jgi:flagellar motor switch protein FliG
MADGGLLDAAILLMSIGEEEASEVFKYLSPKEVQALGETMTKLKVVESSKIEEVLTSFQDTANARRSLVSDTDQYVRNVLNKALGADKAGFLIDRILQGRDVSGIEGLKWMDPVTVAELIRNEHPQIIASILVHLEREQASSILALLAERTRNDVILRIAMLDGIQPNALKELNEVLSSVMAGSEKLKKTALGGIKTAAEILNFMSSGIETATVEAIRTYDPDLAQKVMDQMFTFDNLLELDDKAVQLVLREVQAEALVVALKGSDAALRDKIYKNMSVRAAESLKDDLESKGPVRVSDVESEQRAILNIIRRLADEGQIAIGGKGEGALV